MSTFRGWKEERIRRHIYLDQLKTAQNSSGGVSLSGVHFEECNGRSVFQERPDSLGESQTSAGNKNDRFWWTMVRLGVLGAGAAVWFWIHAGQPGLHR
jgi:hypothetical protein